MKDKPRWYLLEHNTGITLLPVVGALVIVSEYLRAMSNVSIIMNHGNYSIDYIKLLIGFIIFLIGGIRQQMISNGDKK